MQVNGQFQALAALAPAKEHQPPKGQRGRLGQTAPETVWTKRWPGDEYPVRQKENPLIPTVLTNYRGLEWPSRN